MTVENTYLYNFNKNILRGSLLAKTGVEDTLVPT